MQLSDFQQANSPAEFIAVAKGDIRTAESAAWQFWYRSGATPNAREPIFAQMAIAIAETKYAGQH